MPADHRSTAATKQARGRAGPPGQTPSSPTPSSAHADLVHVSPSRRGSPERGAACCLATRECYKYLAVSTGVRKGKGRGSRNQAAQPHEQQGAEGRLRAIDVCPRTAAGHRGALSAPTAPRWCSSVAAAPQQGGGPRGVACFGRHRAHEGTAGVLPGRARWCPCVWVGTILALLALFVLQQEGGYQEGQKLLEPQPPLCWAGLAPPPW